MNLSLALKYIMSLTVSKKSYLLISFLSSFLLTLGTDKIDILNKLYEHIEVKEGVIPLIVYGSLIALTGLFIIADFITGIIASRHEGGRIQSSKWGVTIGKVVGLFLYSCLASVVILLLSNSYIVLTMVFGPVILTLLKEYISIGENFERRFGKKAYMFTIVDKMFDILEMRFFKTLQEKEFDKNSSNDCEAPEYTEGEDISEEQH